MKKIFYKTIEKEEGSEYVIMGMSDGQNSMSFDYITVEEDYHSTAGLHVEEIDGKLQVIPNQE